MACGPREVVAGGAAVIVDWVEAEDDASCAKSCAVESIYDDLIPCWDCARFSTERDALVALPDGEDESGGDGKREAPPLDDVVFFSAAAARADSLPECACDDEYRDVEADDEDGDEEDGDACAGLCDRAGLDEDCWREGASLDRLVER